MKKYFLVLSLSILTLVGCSQQNSNEQTTPVNSKSTEISIASNAYSNKQILALDDVEMFFKSKNFNLVKKNLEQPDSFKLMEKYPAEYYLNGDKNQELQVYVFSTQEERIKAREEFNNKTAAAIMTYHEIYEIKNIMIFLFAGDNRSECYKTVSGLVQELK